MLEIGKFSVFEATQSMRAAYMFERLCADPEARSRQDGVSVDGDPEASRPVSVRNVNNCTDCPFADDGEAFDGEWSCHAKLTLEGWPMYLHKSRSPARPPKWCPLRQGPIEIRLRGVPRKRS